MKQTLSLNIVMVEDKKLGGYTAFFKQFPEVVVEGENEKEAMSTLIETLQLVLKHDQVAPKIKLPAHVIERTVEFEAVPA